MTIDAGLLALRLLLGLLLIGHGSQKLIGWFGGSGIAAFRHEVRELGFRPAGLWATLAALSQIGGGSLVVVGLLAPLGTLAIIGTLLVALTARWQNGFWNQQGGIEYIVVLLALNALLGLLGPGRYSLDTWLGLSLPAPLSFWAGLALVLVVTGIGFMLRERPDAPAHSLYDSR